MDRLASVRARLQQWERAFARLHGRRPAQVRWGLGAGQGGAWGPKVQPVADQLLLCQEDVEAAPEETRGERWAGGPGTGLMVVAEP